MLKDYKPLFATITLVILICMPIINIFVLFILMEEMRTYETKKEFYFKNSENTENDELNN